MQRLYFEKQIDLDHALQELISVSVNENLVYQDDPKGKRAIGTLEISGEYLRMASKERFNDRIDIDVLAPFDRLEQKENFHLEVQDFDYHIQNGNLNLDIQILVHGVAEKNERHINVDEVDDDEKEILREIQNIVSKQELSETIERTLNERNDDQAAEMTTEEETLQDDENEEKTMQDCEVVREEEIHLETLSDQISVEAETKRDDEPANEDQVQKEIAEPEHMQDQIVLQIVPETSAEDVLQSGPEEQTASDWQDHESIDVEDLFDDTMMAFVTYPIYVVQIGDSYEKIALRYQMDVETLMDYNQHVSIKPHQLLVIPPR